MDIIFQRYKNTDNLKDKKFISLLSSHKATGHLYGNADIRRIEISL